LHHFGPRPNPRIGQPAGFAPGKRELPTNCYRIDPSGRIDPVVTEDQVPDPNGRGGAAGAKVSHGCPKRLDYGPRTARACP